jgi:hypothetical protein
VFLKLLFSWFFKHLCSSLPPEGRSISGPLCTAFQILLNNKY